MGIGVAAHCPSQKSQTSPGGTKMITLDFSGKKVIVTGASTGIGRGIASAFARAGADVAIQYLKSREEAETTAQIVREAGRRAILVQGDFRKPDEIKAAMDAAVSGLG